MNFFTWLTHPWAALWAESLLHFLWQGTLLTGLGALSLTQRNPNTRYNVLVTTFVLMTLCPAATLVWLAQTDRSREASSPASPSRFVSDTATVSPVRAAPALAELVATDVTDDSQRFSLDDLISPDASLGRFVALDEIRPVVLGMWCIGVVMFLLRIVGGMWGVSRLLQTATQAPEAWATVCRQLSRRLGMRGDVPVRISRHIPEPLVVYWWRPVILFPAAWLAEVPPAVLESVLAHELAHLRRWDLWVNYYQRWGEMVLFYHPGLWWVSRRIRIERELCCDAAAVSLIGKPVEYAHALEFVALKRLELFRPLLAQGMGGTEMTLLNRIQRVLGLEAPRRTATGWPLGLATMAVLIVGGLLATGSSRAVVGDEQVDRAAPQLFAQNDQDDVDEEEPAPPPRRPGGPPRRHDDDGPPPRDGGPGPRFRGDGPPPERAFDDDEGDRPVPPRGPGGFGLGRRGGPPPEGDMMRELMHELRALRQEVSELRHEVRALRGDGEPDERRGQPPRGMGGRRRGPDDRRGGPPPGSAGFGRRGDDEFGPPRDGERRGPPPDGPRGARPQRPDDDDPPAKVQPSERPADEKPAAGF